MFDITGRWFILGPFWTCEDISLWEHLKEKDHEYIDIYTFIQSDLKLVWSSMKQLVFKNDFIVTLFVFPIFNVWIFWLMKENV